MRIDQELKSLEIQKKLVEYQGEDRVVLASELLEEIKKNEQEIFRIKTSIPKLDEIIGGFNKGNVIIVSAPTGGGKTTFCKTLTKNFNKEGQKCLWFSYEVVPEEFFMNFSGETQYVTMPRELVSGKLEWIENRILESKAKFNTNIIFIDHLHFLIEMKDLAIAKSQSILLGTILRKLKEIALNHGMIIILIAHMRKLDLEEKIPNIDDLRDSSFVSQEADTVLLLWRQQLKRTKEEKEYGMPAQWTNNAILSVVKNRRTGKLGFIKLVYNEIKNEFLEEDLRFMADNVDFKLP